MIFLLCAVLGFFAGLLSGLFGLGGGLLIVPVLLIVYGPDASIASIFLASVAVSLTSTASVFSYGHLAIERFKVLWPMMIGAFVFSLFASWVHSTLDNTVLSAFAAAFLHFLALLIIILGTKPEDSLIHGQFKKGLSAIAGAVIGLFGGLAGIGAGAYSTLYVVRMVRRPWAEGVQVAQVIGMMIGIASTIGFICFYGSKLASSSTVSLSQGVLLVCVAAPTAWFSKPYASHLSPKFIRYGIMITVGFAWVSVIIRAIF